MSARPVSSRAVASAGVPSSSASSGEARVPFEYAVIRVVPRVDRGEAMNAGVLLYCRALDYLSARWDVDRDRLAALDPTADADAVEASVRAAANCADPDATARTDLGRDSGPGQRFRWLTAPRSTVVQPGPIHTGLTTDPAAELDRLFTALVLPIPR